VSASTIGFSRGRELRHVTGKDRPLSRTHSDLHDLQKVAVLHWEHVTDSVRTRVTHEVLNVECARRDEFEVVVNGLDARHQGTAQPQEILNAPNHGIAQPVKLLAYVALLPTDVVERSQEREALGKAEIHRAARGLHSSDLVGGGRVVGRRVEACEDVEPGENSSTSSAEIVTYDGPTWNWTRFGTTTSPTVPNPARPLDGAAPRRLTGA
jgi:hypothetical protein